VGFKKGTRGHLRKRGWWWGQNSGIKEGTRGNIRKRGGCRALKIVGFKKGTKGSPQDRGALEGGLSK
jgi:hypothetical protein